MQESTSGSTFLSVPLSGNGGQALSPYRLIALDCCPRPGLIILKENPVSAKLAVTNRLRIVMPQSHYIMALGSGPYHELAQWVEQGGGSLNPAVEIYHDEVTKGSFRVRDGYQIEEGDAIVTLPLSRSLSFLNAVRGHPDMPAIPYSNISKPENSPYFPREFLEKTPPHVVGRFFLMQQYLLGQDGLWWPYVQTLPQPEHMGGSLPALWPADDVEFLEGTNAYVAVQEIKTTLKKEFKNAMKLLPDSFSSTLECFSHIDDSLVVSLYETISRGTTTENGVGVCDILQGNIPAGLKGKIINALGSKISMDLEEIEAHDPKYAASNRNQQLALHYREQCKKVLEHALTTLAGHIGES
ncbi:hypothetical protein DL764_000043 [Monosporascus ibericus]|uniref:Uncharacterized protein n=1 Tax=Monosporascus ibericus TaxID=155417 RepID=A0A4V1XCY7_9PEZI|nr:hypothetical protein DL764_000043 [Monosporascus ibericus]